MRLPARVAGPYSQSLSILPLTWLTALLGFRPWLPFLLSRNDAAGFDANNPEAGRRWPIPFVAPACDAVTMARPLLANPGLPHDLAAGMDGPHRTHPGNPPGVRRVD